MKHGNCKMCLLDKDLASSHLIPAALYDDLHEGEHRPIRIGDGIVIPTDRQTEHPLLCNDCEIILNQGGESWMNSNLCTYQKSFPLYDMVIKCRTHFVEERDGGLYAAADNPLINIQKITHFALGIFWKASVHSWRGGVTETMIDLGPYSDAIRRWLRSEASFPKHVCFSLTLARPQSAFVALNPPVESEKKAWRTFLLHLRGVMFMLDVGRAIDLERRLVCFHESPMHPILVSDDVMNIYHRRLIEHFDDSRKTAAYLRQKAKPRPIK